MVCVCEKILRIYANACIVENRSFRIIGIINFLGEKFSNLQWESHWTNITATLALWSTIEVIMPILRSTISIHSVASIVREWILSIESESFLRKFPMPEVQQLPPSRYTGHFC